MPEDSSAQAAVDAANRQHQKDATATAENFNGKFVGSSMELATMQPSREQLCYAGEILFFCSRQIQREWKSVCKTGAWLIWTRKWIQTVLSPPPAEESAK